jgi:hypothetical protein
MPRIINYVKLFKKLEEGRPDHAIFSPSSSDKWLNCPGYYHATKNLPATKSGRAAQRGTAAHLLLEQCLLQNKVPDALSHDDELINWVSYAIDYCNSYKVLVPTAQIFPETYFPWLEVSGGTIDVLGISAKELMIGDLKTGNYPVEVKDNTQLLNYAIAARKHLGKKPIYRLVIIQPSGVHREGPVREWLVTDKDLNAFENSATTAIVTNLIGGKRKAGKHCQWCKAEALCEVRADYALEMIELNLRNDFLEEA